MVVRAGEITTFAAYPSAYRLRDTLSNDAIAIWAAEYRHFQVRFRTAARAERLRYLERVGTRYYLLPYAPFPDAREVADVSGFDLPRLYERAPLVPRASVRLEARVELAPNAQTDLMFDEAFDPSRVVLLDATPPEPTPGGAPSASAAAEIVEDAAGHVVVRASVPAPDGFLVLADTFDRNWTVEVDGQPARLLRADGLFRAVRLGAGDHVVRFEYRPMLFYAGVAVSLATALALALASLGGRLRNRHG
jgi:hypothetical protein